MKLLFLLKSHFQVKKDQKHGERFYITLQEERNGRNFEATPGMYGGQSLNAHLCVKLVWIIFEIAYVSISAAILNSKQGSVGSVHPPLIPGRHIA